MANEGLVPSTEEEEKRKSVIQKLKEVTFLFYYKELHFFSWLNNNLNLKIVDSCVYLMSHSMAQLLKMA